MITVPPTQTPTWLSHQFVRLVGVAMTGSSRPASSSDRARRMEDSAKPVASMAIICQFRIVLDESFHIVPDGADEQAGDGQTDAPSGDGAALQAKGQADRRNHPWVG